MLILSRNVSKLLIEGPTPATFVRDLEKAEICKLYKNFALVLIDNAGHNHNHAVQNVGKKAEAEETKRKSNLPPPTNQVVYFVQSS